MGPRNVLHMIETSEPGGAETVLANIAGGLNADRYRSQVCVLEEGWLTERLAERNIPYTVIENRRRYDPLFLHRLMQLIRSERIGLMHSHEFMMTVYGSIASRLTGVPLVGTVHGKVYFPENKRRVRALKLAVSLSRKTIAVSEDLHRYLVGTLGFNSEKVVTLHNGIDLRKYSPRLPREKSRERLSIQAGARVIGTAGSLFKVKGLRYLLETARELKSRYPDHLFLIAGEGDQEKMLRERVRELGLGDSVRFLGFCENIPEFLSALDVYVCSSLSEGLSLSILEAMAMSKPVVATDVGGNPELVRDSENGYLVPPAEPSALAEKIALLLDSPDLACRLGETGRRFAEEKFSLQRMLREYEKLYERCIRQ